MSKILSMQLSNKSVKPIFAIMTPSHKLVKCMLDTGADMPVWCGSEARNFGCDLILSATMFSHMDYSILNRKRGTSVLQILFDRDTYYTFLVPNGKYLEIAERYLVLHLKVLIWRMNFRVDEMRIMVDILQKR